MAINAVVKVLTEKLIGVKTSGSIETLIDEVIKASDSERKLRRGLM